MSESPDKLPTFRLLAKDGEPPRVEFSITEHNADDLRAFVRRIPELRGIPGPQGTTGDGGIGGARGEAGRRGRRGERGFTPDHDATEVDGGFMVRFQQPGGGWGDPLEVRQGIPGPKGDDGAQGIPGPKGDTGDDGAKGEEGPRGLKGLKGAKGAKGEPGPMGGRGGGRSANPTWDVIEIVGTDLVFRRSTAGPLGPSTTVAFSEVLALDDLTDVTITAPADGDHLVKSSGDWINQQPNVQREFLEKMGEYSLIQSDFTVSGIVAEGVSAVAAGGGAGIFSPLAIGGEFSDHPGIWEMRTGATPSGRVFIISRASSYNIGVGGITCVGTWMKTGLVLSDAATRYSLRSGFSSVVLPDTLLNAVSFEYRDDQNGGRWQAITFDGVTETSTDTGVTVAANTWYRLEFEINAAGTSVEFFIDGVSVAINTGNIPRGTLFGLFYNTHILKSVGGGARRMFIDAYYVYQELTR